MRFSGLTLIVALLASTIASALPQKPQGSYVYDEDRLMNSRQIDFFDRLSKELLDKTGICVAAVIVDDIEHADARTYASRIATEWNESSNGTILIFAAIKQRKRIVEAAGTAAGLLSVHESERLQQELLMPAFRKEKYGEGVMALAYGIATSIASDKGVALEIDASAIPEEAPMTVRGWIFIIVVFGLLIIVGRKGHRFGFFDNMKKLLCVSEIEKSQWPGIFKSTFGDNLVTAYLSGKCLMEGFDALASPWTISFVLKDNSPEEVSKIRAFEKRARRENIVFAHFYSLAEVAKAVEGQPAQSIYHGLYYLETGTFPQTNEQVTEYFHDLYQANTEES